MRKNLDLRSSRAVEAAAKVREKCIGSLSGAYVSRGKGIRETTTKIVGCQFKVIANVTKNVEIFAYHFSPSSILTHNHPIVPNFGIISSINELPDSIFNQIVDLSMSGVKTKIIRRLVLPLLPRPYSWISD